MKLRAERNCDTTAGLRKTDLQTLNSCRSIWAPSRADGIAAPLG